MKRVSIAAAVGLAVIVGLMLNVQQTVSANGAIVIHDNGECGMPGSDANGDLIGGGTGNTFLSVENDNKVMIKCIGHVINESGMGQSYEGFTCGIVSGQEVLLTEDTHATVSASGVGTMTCTYRKQ